MLNKTLVEVNKISKYHGRVADSVFFFLVVLLTAEGRVYHVEVEMITFWTRRLHVLQSWAVLKVSNIGRSGGI